MRKVIYWELRKKFKFDHANKRYMHNPESVLENEMLKIFRDFEMQTDHLISARRPQLVIVKKKKKEKEKEKRNLPFDYRVKLKENKKRDKYLDLPRELRKTMEHESDGDTNSIDIGSGGLGNKSTFGDRPKYSIVEIGQNTKKSPGDLRRLVVTQTPVKNHQLTLVWKTLKWVK